CARFFYGAMDYW
nr:immunoglobulin heavy chain junction region [Mus musculus]MBK4197235.1 immunoglobulin heavy chain junction region [Mus musculus]MBK4197236.1 immunoglobulin heavy chain junction region [Mus musculus]